MIMIIYNLIRVLDYVGEALLGPIHYLRIALYHFWALIIIYELDPARPMSLN